MSVALVQLLLCPAAGYLLWRIWRALSAEDPHTRWIVFAGFMGRAITGTVLFWISYLRLPFLRSLQMGDGLWFFGSDAVLYVPTAIAAAESGIDAIIGHTRTAASVSYVQSLALFAYLFGTVASVALLLNLFCYLGTCLVIVKLRKATPAGWLPGTLALAAISLSPSAVLWSLQPLKDTLFQFLIILFVAACAMWQRGWREQPTPLLVAASGAIMFTALFLISGIRWYVALAALVASLAFFVMVGTTVPKKSIALTSGLMCFALLTQAFIYGAGAYTPPRVMAIFSLATPSDERIAALSPRAFAADLHLVRDNFDRAGGDTSIGMGTALTRLSAPTSQPSSESATETSVPPPAVQPTKPAESVDVRDAASSKLASSAAESRETNQPATAAEPAEPPQESGSFTAPVQRDTAVRGPAHVVIASDRPAPPPLPAAPNPEVPSGTVSPDFQVSAEPKRETSEAPASASSAAPSSLPAPKPQPPVTSQSLDDAPNPVEPESTSVRDLKPVATKSRGPEAPNVAMEQQSSKSNVDERQSNKTSGDSGLAKTASVATTEAPTSPRAGRKRDARPRPVITAAQTPRRRATTEKARPTTTTPAGTVAVKEPSGFARAAQPSQQVSSLASQPARSPTVPPAIILPSSPGSRIVTGMVAMFLPRSLADRLRLIEVGGGKGFFWFSDLDTLVFDVVLVFVVVYFARRTGWATVRNPTFWFVVLIALLVGGPLAYTITNFGTLFRLRLMIYTIAALLPLALAMAAADLDPPASRTEAMPVREET